MSGLRSIRKPAKPARKIASLLLASVLVLPAFGSLAHADAAAGEFSFDSTYYSIGEADSSVMLTVNRTGGSSGEVTVDYATMDGSAYGGGDYYSDFGTLAFADGETSKTIYIGINDDFDTEGDEGFSIALSNPTGGATVSASAYADVNILDNDNWIPDPPGQLSLFAANYTVNEGAGSVLLSVSRTGGSAGAVTVDYSTSSGSAAQGTDFGGVSGKLQFAEGETWADIEVPIVNEDMYEGDENFTMTLSNPTGDATIGNGSATVTIADNDPDVPRYPGVLEFGNVNYSIDENDGSGMIQVTIKRSGGSDGWTAVDYAFADFTAVKGSDYDAYDGDLYFAPGETEKTIYAYIYDDSESEGDEKFSITLSNPRNGATLGADSEANVTIADDEPWTPLPGVLELNTPTPLVNEGVGTAQFTVSRSGGSSGEVTVDYSVGDSSASEGSDYTGTGGTLVFGDGETWKNIQLPIIDDSEYEGDENFTLTLSNPRGGAAIGTVGSSVVTIEDNDTYVPGHPGQFEFVGDSYYVNEGDENGQIHITVERNNGTDGEVTVDYALEGGSASGGIDFEPVYGTLTFTPEQRYGTISIPIINDTEMEGEESFAVMLSNPTNGATLGTRWAAAVTIGDDDEWIPDPPGEFNLESASYSVGEGEGYAMLTVNRTNGAGGEVTVDYGIGGGSASEGADFGGTGGTLVFAEGETAKTIEVPVYDDSEYEGDEQFSVSLFNPTGGASVGSLSSANVTITDNDPAIHLQLSASTYYGIEESGWVTVKVIRTGSAEEAVTVNYATVSGSAKAAADFTSASGKLTFAKGETSKTIKIKLFDDKLKELNESFSMQLSNPAGGAVLGAQASAAVSILDADHIKLSSRH
ncbi:Calx-beta domain-containing protein [Paenibacillus solisilvae]|uniref:Calx-beta domain-containing protein n=1 Tax=Paenibacillus solisilvae TaxID=2486751 RepID=A0ABW0VV74_9BACL